MLRITLYISANPPDENFSGAVSSMNSVHSITVFILSPDVDDFGN
jgi:hypothetical protein